MAEILNYNPEDNPRLQEIYEILLLAGYFRIRISSLKAFDKIIGGIAWCITSSNFEVEVEYNDEMQIGQKIKVSEHICHALKNMKCPYDLQPFQLQGLDVDKIFPIVQWLIKFVYETRWERQKYNREIALRESKTVINVQEHGNKEAIRIVSAKRVKINKAVMATKTHNPIRVYSALLEHSDMTSLKMYNKLHNMMVNKKDKKKGKNGQKVAFNAQQDENQAANEDFMEIMNPDKDSNRQNQDEESNSQQISLEHFTAVAGNKISLNKLEQIIEQNKQNFENVIREAEKGNNENIQSSQEAFLRKYQQQNAQQEEQIKALQAQMRSMDQMIESNQTEREIFQHKNQQLMDKLSKKKEKYEEIVQYGKEIDEELKQQKIKTKEMEKKVQRRMQLKEKKSELKKRAQAKLDQLQDTKYRVLASIPEIDEQAFQQMIEEAELKKNIYTNKYEQLTLLNQELAIIQRKAESYTSAPEIAQYHQRFVELFEAINFLIEQKRSIYSEMTNLESIQKLVNNYKEFLANAKEGIEGAKKKETKRELTQDFKEVLGGFETNMNNSKSTLTKMEKGLEKTYSEYSALVKLEREYLKKLRELKIEYENAEKNIEI